MAALNLQALGVAMVVLAVVVAVGIYILVQVNTSLGATTASIINNFVTALGQFGTWASILVIVGIAAVVLDWLGMFSAGAGGSP